MPFILPRMVQRLLDLETAACCIERKDGGGTESLACGTGCLYFTWPHLKLISAQSLTVNNIMDVWECDLCDVQGLSKHNDGVQSFQKTFMSCL
jgi:hypothetical protein